MSDETQQRERETCWWCGQSDVPHLVKSDHVYIHAHYYDDDGSEIGRMMTSTYAYICRACARRVEKIIRSHIRKEKNRAKPLEPAPPTITRSNPHESIS